jgi:hypothetical protein
MSAFFEMVCFWSLRYMKKFPLSELLSVIKYPVLFLAIYGHCIFIDYHWNLDLYYYGVNPRTMVV